jgi:hypothetical protein
VVEAQEEEMEQEQQEQLMDHLKVSLQLLDPSPPPLQIA